MKLKLGINVCDISLYINYIFLLSLRMCFCCYGNLKFPYTYNAGLPLTSKIRIRPDMTEKLLTGTLSLNTTNQNQEVQDFHHPNLEVRPINIEQWNAKNSVFVWF